MAWRALAVFILLKTGVSPAMAAEPSRIPCWQVEAFVKAHGGDKDAARRSALARGFSRDDVRDAERRCLR